MANCIIHIGMHKTGSTSIQQSLHRFSDSHFYYASLGSASNHSLAMYSLFADHPEKHHLHNARRRDEAAIQMYIAGMRSDLEQAIAAASERTMLISGEDIGVLSESELRRLRKQFSESFDKILIVGYVRPPASFISSAFQQKVKGGSISHFDINREYRNYERSFSKFDEVFGRENVHLWKFALDTFPGGCVVQDICKRLDVELPVERVLRVNESLSKFVISSLYTYNKFAGKLGFENMTGPESMRLGRVLADADDSKFRFSPDIIRPILVENRKDIDWMETRLGETLLEDLSPHQPGDIRVEEDLLTPDSHLVDKILTLLGDLAPTNISGETPEEVALLVNALREKHRNQRILARQGKRISVKKIEEKIVNTEKVQKKMPTGQSKDRIEIADLIEQIGQANPGLIASFPEGKAEALLQKVFQQISSTLSAKDEGLVRVISLGQFRIKKVERGIGSSRIVRSKIFFRKAETGFSKENSSKTENNAPHSSVQPGANSS